MKRLIAIALLIFSSPASAQSIDEFQATLHAFACSTETGEQFSIALADANGAPRLVHASDTLSDGAEMSVTETDTGWRLDGASFQGYLSLIDEGWSLFASSELGQITAPCTDISETAAAISAASLGLAQPSAAATQQQPKTRIYTTAGLSDGDKTALQAAIADCWNTGMFSTDALLASVVVGFDLTPDAFPINGSLRLVSHTGGSDYAVRQLYESARSAVLRCGRRGFPLFGGNYADWRRLQVRFGGDGIWVD